MPTAPTSLAATSLVPVYAALFIVVGGNGLMTTLVPLRASLEGFPDASIGAMGSVYFAGMFAGSLGAAALVRRAGSVRAFAALAAVAAASALAFAVFVSPAAWVGLRAVQGACLGGLYVVMESWVNARSPNARRGRALALYNVVNFAGSALGQQVLRLDGPQSFALFSAAAAFYVLGLLPMAMTRAEPPPPPPRGRIDVRGLWRAAPVAVVGVVLVGLANGSLWTLAPAAIAGAGGSPAVVASFMTAVVLGSALSPLPIGRLSDGVDRRRVIVGVSLAAAAAEFALWWTGGPEAFTLFLLAFAVGATAPVLYVLAGAHANDRTPPHLAVSLASTLLALYCAGGVVGPLVASLLKGPLGPMAPFLDNAVIHLALALFALWRVLRRDPPPAAAAAEATGRPAV